MDWKATLPGRVYTESSWLVVSLLGRTLGSGSLGHGHEIGRIHNHSALPGVSSR